MINNINEGGRIAENLVHLPNPTHLYHVKFFSTGALTLQPPPLPLHPSNPLYSCVAGLSFYPSLSWARISSAAIFQFSSASEFQFRTSVHVGQSQAEHLRQLNRLIFSYFQLFAV